jgi:hypothetical protein
MDPVITRPAVCATLNPPVPARGRTGWAALSRSAVAVLLVCGCSPQPKKAEATVPPREAKAPPAVHRARVVHKAKHADHQLSQAERDKIFKGFERWLADHPQERSGGTPPDLADRAAEAPERPVE